MYTVLSFGLVKAREEGSYLEGSRDRTEGSRDRTEGSRDILIILIRERKASLCVFQTFAHPTSPPACSVRQSGSWSILVFIFFISTFSLTLANYNSTNTNIRHIHNIYTEAPFFIYFRCLTILKRDKNGM